MLEPAPEPSRPTAQTWLSERRLLYLIVALIAVASVSTVTYYEVSYHDVNGTVITLMTGRRSVSTSFFGNPCSSVAYYLTVDIGSWAGRLDTRVSDPTFGLIVDSLYISSSQGGGGTFSPYGALEYVLTFGTSDGTIANAICDGKPHTLTVTVDALVSAGMFAEQITRSDSKTWSF